MSNDINSLYAFAMKGMLTTRSVEEALKIKKTDPSHTSDRYADVLSLNRLDFEVNKDAHLNSIVYIAIYLFENKVRDFIKSVMYEQYGTDWWLKVPDKIQKIAEARRIEEQNVRWHMPRGEQGIQYADFDSLASIIKNQWDLFSPFLGRQEWVDSVFYAIKQSRNTIMHSNVVHFSDVERLGIYIRDWLNQTGL